MTRLLGNWAIQWTDDDGDHVLELDVPLWHPRPAGRVTAWQRDALDYSSREVRSIGSGVHEAVADIKFSRQAQQTIDMLLAGVRGKTLTVIPDVDDPDRSWDCDLIEPGPGAMETTMDADSDAHEWHMVTIRLRRTNGKPFI